MGLYLKLFKVRLVLLGLNRQLPNWLENELTLILTTYNPDDIYNLNESGFFSILPEKYSHLKIKNVLVVNLQNFVLQFC